MSGNSSMWKRDTDDQKGGKWTAKMRVCVEIFVSKNTYLLSPLSQSFLFLVFRFPKLLFFIAGIGSGSRLTFCVLLVGTSARCLAPGMLVRRRVASFGVKVGIETDASTESLAQLTCHAGPAVQGREKPGRTRGEFLGTFPIQLS